MLIFSRDVSFLKIQDMVGGICEIDRCQLHNCSILILWFNVYHAADKNAICYKTFCGFNIILQCFVTEGGCLILLNPFPHADASDASEADYFWQHCRIANWFLILFSMSGLTIFHIQTIWKYFDSFQLYSMIVFIYREFPYAIAAYSWITQL